MRFAKLYRDNREAVERNLRAIWCSETANESQKAYAQQIKEIIHKHLFAPADAMPLVQCMNSYEPVHSVSAEEAKSLVGNLWRRKEAPYEHQYKSWHTLLKDFTEEQRPMSICVTTGTGSGKTECFMMPLVEDLKNNAKANEIQAIFLYPLNALMEDQKERLEELLDGTELTYTVYNGDLPETIPSNKDHTKAAEKLRARIRNLRGEFKDENGEIKHRFPRFVYTREMVRKNPPNIILTNPTMLEYILLRDKDSNLTNPDAKSLRWIVIDETHNYTGAGAAEMAMLLRRVMLAFGVRPENIRFATSSATFGNGDDPQQEEKQLKEFISGVTGIGFDQVKVIKGKRIGEGCIPESEDKPRWELIFSEDFVSLDRLFPEGSTIEEKLDLLDEMCDRVPKDEKGNPLLKAKAHFFYRVANNGIFVRLTEHANGAFKIYPLNNIAEDEESLVPLLELSRCKHCGEYVALTRVNTSYGKDYGKYEPLERVDSDMFDLIEDFDAEEDKKYYIVSLSNHSTTKGDNNIAVRINGDRLITAPELTEDVDWHLVANTHGCCPCCNSKLTHKKDDDEKAPSEQNDAVTNSFLFKFRISPEFISRILAPSILDNVEKGLSKDPKKIVMHEGQQFLSFSDSRQLAARSTLKQNLEEERLWFYSTIYHELCRRKASQGALEAELKRLRAKRRETEDEDEIDDLSDKIKKIQSQICDFLSWSEIVDLFRKDKYMLSFCEQFVRRNSDSEEMDGNEIPLAVIDKYINSIMVMYLSYRPASAGAPETMGLFHSYFPQLERLKLPEAVTAFNGIFDNEDNKISAKDWRDLMRTFLDYQVRLQQSIFLKISDTNPIDIFSCERFAAEKPRRHPVIKATMEPGKMSPNRIVRLLCALIVRDKPYLKPSDAYRRFFNELNAVMEALWDQAIDPDNKIIEQSQHWENGQFELDRDEGNYRLNVANMAIKLYDEAWICDTNSDIAQRHTHYLRPIPYSFKGFSPFLIQNKVVELDLNQHEKWTLYPFYIGSGKENDVKVIKDWAKENRKLLWENNLWNEEGIFSNRLNEVHQFPNLFIQAEHTAQVDKEVSRGLQSEFKDHTINILACSTTMEMGVDLGNLEVVLLNSVPPTPANYKQRSGRSGRNEKVASVCITLCGSDAIGLRTLFNPLENIINRKVKVPTVDLMSPQVVQRHINSYLVRAFGVFRSSKNAGSLAQKVVDYYSPFYFIREGDHLHVSDANGSIKIPTDKLGDETDTPYDLFNKKCSEPLDPAILQELVSLLSGTVFENKPDYVVRKAMESNQDRYSELCLKLEDYAQAFRSTDNDNFRRKLTMQYIEVLYERLLNFWATNRFTPNANMPVNVLSLDLNSNSNYFSTSMSSNPSYGVREAIAQYAPGNNIVVDGVAYTVRGIDYSDRYQGTRTFKKIYRNAEKCVIDDPTLDTLIRWEVNHQQSVDLIQPTQFLPDINEERSRIMETNDYTHVNAQLIGASEWEDSVQEPHLFSVRNNLDSGEAKILYYNEGIGFGYCFCPKCGKMILEENIAPEDNPMDKLPPLMNPRRSKVQGRPNYHYHIARRNDHNRPMLCVGSYDGSIRRNVIVGDLIQTDYSEIRIRHKGKTTWMRGMSEKELLYTLGIVFTQALIDILGKEQGAVDFTIMPNGHICIFDTNPGGAGYSNQLTSLPLMKEVIQASKRMLAFAKSKKSKDLLLNKFTLRYLKYVDLDAALHWIEEEESIHE